MQVVGTFLNINFKIEMHRKKSFRELTYAGIFHLGLDLHI